MNLSGYVSTEHEPRNCHRGWADVEMELPEMWPGVLYRTLEEWGYTGERVYFCHLASVLLDGQA